MDTIHNLYGISLPNASTGLASQYREENRARERERSHINHAITDALNGNIAGLESAGLSGYYTANSRGYIYKVYIDGFGSTYNAQSGGISDYGPGSDFWSTTSR